MPPLITNGTSMPSFGWDNSAFEKCFQDTVTMPFSLMTAPTPTCAWNAKCSACSRVPRLFADLDVLPLAALPAVEAVVDAPGLVALIGARLRAAAEVEEQVVGARRSADQHCESRHEREQCVPARQGSPVSLFHPPL
jgi:hypothetical protein